LAVELVRPRHTADKVEENGHVSLFHGTRRAIVVFYAYLPSRRFPGRFILAVFLVLRSDVTGTD
jgi:hypothetical protein